MKIILTVFASLALLIVAGATSYYLLILVPRNQAAELNYKRQHDAQELQQAQVAAKTAQQRACLSSKASTTLYCYYTNEP